MRYDTKFHFPNARKDGASKTSGDFQGHLSNSSEAHLLAASARDVHIPTRLPVPVHPVSYYGMYVAGASVVLVVLVVLVLFVKWKRQPILDHAPQS